MMRFSFASPLALAAALPMLALAPSAQADDHYFDASEESVVLEPDPETGEVIVAGETYEPGRFVVYADGEWIMMLVTSYEDVEVDGELVREFDWDQGSIQYADTTDDDIDDAFAFALTVYNVDDGVTWTVNEGATQLIAQNGDGKEAETKPQDPKPNTPNTNKSNKPTTGKGKTPPSDLRGAPHPNTTTPGGGGGFGTPEMSPCNCW